MAIVEGGALRGDRREEADVLVIGSGAGGATVAMRLAEAGKRVLVLERGGYYTGLVDPLDPARPGRGELDQREDDMLARIDGGRGLTTTGHGPPRPLAESGWDHLEKAIEDRRRRIGRGGR